MKEDILINKNYIILNKSENIPLEKSIERSSYKSNWLKNKEKTNLCLVCKVYFVIKLIM